MGKKQAKRRKAKKDAEAAVPEKPRRPISLIVFVLSIIAGGVAWAVKDMDWGITVGVIGIIIAGAIEAFTDPPAPKKGGSSDAINFGG